MVISNTAIDADGSYFFLIMIGRLICGNSQRLLLNLALETLWIWVGSSFLVFYGGINSISSICSINKVLLDRSSLGKKSFLEIMESSAFPLLLKLILRKLEFDSLVL